MEENELKNPSSRAYLAGMIASGSASELHGPEPVSVARRAVLIADAIIAQVELSDTAGDAEAPTNG